MLTIRKATKEDSDVLSVLYRELEEDAVRYQPEHFVLSPDGTRTEQMKDFWDSDHQAMFVADLDGEVIGFAHAVLIPAKKVPCLKPQTALYLQDLIVTAEYRSQGIGAKLMDVVRQYGKDNGADFFRTQVFPKNEAGLRFYHRIGFKEAMITIERSL